MADRKTDPAGRELAARRSWPANVKTLAVDVGGTRIKASILDRRGKLLVPRVRIDTPYPSPPEVLIETLRRLTRDLPEYHRVSVGFPGLIRKGVVREVPALSRRKPGGPRDPKLAARWEGFPLRDVLEKAFGVPTLVANDADVQGSAVVRGKGVELVVTLGTGVGTALFEDGVLLPHLELSHGHLKGGASIDAAVGAAERARIGNKRWNRRVSQALRWLERMVLFDRVYVGGGNAKNVEVDLGPRAKIVSNTAGITGGIRLWDRYDGPIFRRPVIPRQERSTSARRAPPVRGPGSRSSRGRARTAGLPWGRARATAPRARGGDGRARTGARRRRR
jgi:polyphosphate glucokinase